MSNSLHEPMAGALVESSGGISDQTAQICFIKTKYFFVLHVTNKSMNLS